MRSATWAVRACAASRTELVIDRPTQATIATAATTRAAPTITTAIAVTRIRSLRRPSSIVCRHAIALATHRLDRRAAERPVDLGAKVPDVDLHDVEVAVEALVPHVLDDV